MIVIFRADASTKIGTGHVMRCLTLADALKNTGAQCHFISRKHDGNLNDYIEERSYTVHHLNVDSQEKSINNSRLEYSKWLGVSQMEDARQCKEILSDILPYCVVVDHYALDRDWEQSVRRYAKKIMVIDDLADREHDCDLLLDQTYGRNDSDYETLVPYECRLLCGAEYSLLRPEFAKWRKYSLSRRKSGNLHQLLINLGGIDKDNLTSKVLTMLKIAPFPAGFTIMVVMGRGAPHTKGVQEIAEQMPWHTIVEVGVENMAELMSNADLAIGASGTTTWERCCLGLPTLMLVLAENQRVIAKALYNEGVCEVVELKKPLFYSTIKKVINEIWIKRAVSRSSKIVDGLGVNRVSEIMLHGK